ncbi:MAG TPA: acyltransferase, partial [Thermoanaerobaculia bacterium]|nr:acyltransferase [Thermoanaerobaculia bacterium]
LLLAEVQRTADVDVRRFYLRRACRIWPLYFLIVFFGLAFYNVLLPLVGIQYRVEYSVPFALLLYTFLLPNLMNSLYTVGGILNPLWSIGVEEQFYLVWGPAVKRFHRVLPRLCWGVLVVSLLVSWMSQTGVFGWHAMRKLTDQLEIHFMAAGALCAWALHRHRERFLALPVFSSRVLQLTLFALLLDFYLAYLIKWGLADEIVQMCLYAWLIVTVAANPRNVIRVETRAFEFLGKISYGFYLYHMIAVYMTSAAFKAWRWWEGNLWLYCAAYYAMAFGLTVLFAHVSYRWFELPFLRLKDRRFSTEAAASEVMAGRAA